MKFNGNTGDKFTVSGTDVIAPIAGEVLEYDYIDHQGKRYDFSFYFGGRVDSLDGSEFGVILTSHRLGNTYIKNVMYGYPVSPKKSGLRLGKHEETFVKTSNLGRKILATDEIVYKFKLHTTDANGQDLENGGLICLYDGSGVNKLAVGWYTHYNGLLDLKDKNDVVIPHTFELPNGTIIDVSNAPAFDLRTAGDGIIILKFSLPEDSVNNGLVYLSSTSNEGRFTADQTAIDLKIGKSYFPFNELTGNLVKSTNGEILNIRKKAPTTTELADIEANVWAFLNTKQTSKRIQIKSGDSITMHDGSTFNTEGYYSSITHAGNVYPLNEAIGTKIISDKGNIATLSSELWIEKRLKQPKYSLSATNKEVLTKGSTHEDDFGNVKEYNGNSYDFLIADKTFNSVDSMLNYDLQKGKIYRTTSYHLGKHYGGNTYLASNKKDVQINGGTYLLAENGMVLELLHNNTVTFFDFGAISNENPEFIGNDSYTAIQNAFNCGLNVEGNAGHFYTTKGLECLYPMLVKMKGRLMKNDKSYTYDTNGNIIGEETGTTYNNLTRIYSDQNIELITYKSKSVHIEGGFFDMRLASTHDKGVVVIDMDVDMDECSMLGTTIAGNISSSAPIDGHGDIGFHIKRSHKQRGGGSIVYSNFNVNIHSCKYSIKNDPRNTNINGGAIEDITWGNDVNIWGHIAHYKTAIHSPEYNIQIGYKFTVQPYWSLHPNEVEMPSLEINGAEYADIDTWDHKPDKHPTLNIYMQKNKGYISNALLVGKSFKEWNIGSYRDTENSRTSPLITPPRNNDSIQKNPLNLVLNTKPERLQNGAFIAPFNNFFAYLHKRGIADVYVQAFSGTKISDGSPYILENELQSSVGLANAASNVTIENPNSMFEFERHGDQTEVTFNTGADENTDFVEIGLGASYTYTRQLMALIMGNVNFKSLQLIQITSSATTSQYWLKKDECFGKLIGKQNYNPLYDFGIKGLSPSQSKFILRIVGGEIGSTYIIQEIAAEAYNFQSTGSYFPLATTSGDQDIHGVKDFKNGIKVGTSVPDDGANINDVLAYLRTFIKD